MLWQEKNDQLVTFLYFVPKNRNLLLDKDLLEIKDRSENVQTPHKKPRGGELTEQQNIENKDFSSTRRIFVEHVIRLLRIFRVTKERFRLHPSTYEQIIFVVCGLVRLRLGTIDLSVSKQS
jgi:hypothetical protein